MIDLFREYLPAFLIAIVIGVIVGVLFFRPRQSVRLGDTAPIRPHMPATVGREDRSGGDSPRERNGLASEAAAAASDVTGEILGIPVHRNLGDGGDDFLRMKGMGPKFADALKARGFTQFNQLAGLSPEEVERLDPELGTFRGRIGRDRLVEQADYLSRGDQDGFEQKFGKL